MDRENDEDLTYLTIYNVYISVLKKIYYEKRLFYIAILDSKKVRE